MAVMLLRFQPESDVSLYNEGTCVPNYDNSEMFPNYKLAGYYNDFEL